MAARKFWLITLWLITSHQNLSNGNNVVRFGEISPLWQKWFFKKLFKAKFSVLQYFEPFYYALGQFSFVVNGQKLKNNVTLNGKNYKNHIFASKVWLHYTNWQNVKWHSENDIMPIHQTMMFYYITTILSNVIVFDYTSNKITCGRITSVDITPGNGSQEMT